MKSSFCVIGLTVAIMCRHVIQPLGRAVNRASGTCRIRNGKIRSPQYTVSATVIIHLAGREIYDYSYSRKCSLRERAYRDLIRSEFKRSARADAEKISDVLSASAVTNIEGVRQTIAR